MDIIDKAQAVCEATLEQQLAQRPRPPAGPAARRCVDCGDPIPAKRRQAVPGCRRCADCQAEMEGGRYA